VPPANKVIITCAITGAMHTPTMSPHLPFTPEDIAAQAIEAAEAGAAILHLHARDPKDGRPSSDPALFLRFLPQIKAATNAVINITTGASPAMPVEARLAAARCTKPEMASFNVGSMNFSLHPLLNRYKDWKYDWEQPYIAATEDVVFRNTFRDMKHIIRELGDQYGTRFEFECYDLGHLYNVAQLVDEGFIKPPFLLQTIFGILGGMGADMENVTYIRATANRLFGHENYRWSLLGAGRHQISMATVGAIMGGNVRVGLEDSLYLEKGQLARSNAEQVRKIRRILEELSLEIATPEEARSILQLKGTDQVAF
jgi:uncharacterized protein (DUF849 family)